jgi:uncharacterized membrane protein
METASAAGAYRLPVTIRKIGDIDRSGHWLRQGWQDFLATPTISLTYGAILVIVSLVVSVGMLHVGLGSLVLPLAGGFIILAPILVVGLYDVSRRREQGRGATLRDVAAAYGDHAGQLSAMGIVLMLCFWMWVEIAFVLFMGIFSRTPPPLEAFVSDVIFSANGAVLLIVGSAIGAVFAAFVFAITAISVPLIFDRPIDVITAISTSLLAVRSNWRVMFGWAALIAIVLACAMATALLGLAVALPVLAYATWHCYRDIIEPATPPAPDGVAAGPSSGAA